ncbi:hypothetical protein GCM10022231_02380 [Gordonia caeni]|uniref:Uncharacterized protein n=1 Tax=Gordonia caeni TaxID=1007097 RepID=A0ABP7NJI2_9ACTN
MFQSEPLRASPARPAKPEPNPSVDGATATEVVVTEGWLVVATVTVVEGLALVDGPVESVEPHPASTAVVAPMATRSAGVRGRPFILRV